MLILSPLRDGHHRQQLKDEKHFAGGGGGGGDVGGDEVESLGFNGENNNTTVLDFPEFGGGMGNLLDSIDFDDLFIGIHDGDVLPDLEMDSEILDFSVSPADAAAAAAHGGPSREELEYYERKTTSSDSKVEFEQSDDVVVAGGVADDSLTSTTSNSGAVNPNYSTSGTTTATNIDREGGDQEIVSKEEGVHNNELKAAHNQDQLLKNPKESSAHHKFARKPSSSKAQSKNSHGKRKVKVDWTPELHRRFVQAVEQLGVDKAVPSRILELMGIDCLTRHNIASHLQKYRSHRKHLLAREAEAASWTQRRQIYGAAAATATASGGGRGGKSSRNEVAGIMNNSPNWLNAPTMGFPPITSTPTAPPMHHAHHHNRLPHQLIRPLHVWGHPSMDLSMMNMWPKHHLPHNFPSHPLQPPPPPPAHVWPPPPPPADTSYWHHPHHQRAVNTLTPYFPPRHHVATTTRFPTPPVPGIPPPAMYKAEPGIAVSTPHSGPHSTPVDFYPSKESIDAAIGDVLSKPWLPLPLGLRPPVTDTVMVELQRQGVPKIPPSCV